MPTTWKRTFTVLAALLGAGVTVASLAPTAHAAVDPEVQKHFDTGNKLYKEQRYEDALLEYDTAYELSKNWKILYNRAQCLVLLKREPEAIQSFERYLAEGGAEVPSQRRAEVVADIADLKTRLGKVVVENAPPGAKIKLDKVFIGTAPIGPFDAGSGTHDLEVTPANGGQSFKLNIKVTAGNLTAVRVDLAPVAPPGPPPPDMSLGPSPQPDLPRPPAMPVLPELPPGGLLAPAFAFSLSGNSWFGVEHGGISQKPMAAGELAIAYRISPFWEFGLFVAGATGGATVDGSVATVSSTNDRQLYGRVNVDPSAQQRQILGGVRARMHLVRTKHFDGWMGLDFGGWSETWTFKGAEAFTYRASSAAFGLGLGVDIPLSPNWAIGLVGRWFGASATNGRREECGPGAALVCEPGYGLPGEPLNARAFSRSFSDVGLRLVYSLPAGGGKPPGEQKPAAATAAAAIH